MCAIDAPGQDLVTNVADLLYSDTRGKNGKTRPYLYNAWRASLALRFNLAHSCNVSGRPEGERARQRDTAVAIGTIAGTPSFEFKLWNARHVC